MSLVEPPQLLDDLDAHLSMLPGPTGPWQAAGRNRLSDAQTVPVLLWPVGHGAA